ncbi:hypothetical protein HZC00_01400 [Candidatus Kaiserbacteria bacterium]|nr:hypothetical protein [Candidatus Kaiserbacteria bacterium]
MKLFFHLLVASFFVSAPFSALANDQCTKCRDFRLGVNPKLIPSRDARCVPFTQPHPRKVLLRLTLKNGKKRTYTKKNAGTDDCIMVGRHWLRDKTEKMYICNDENHASYPYEDVQAIAHQEKYERVPENTACLFGRDICPEIGYPKIEPVKQ